MDFMNRRKFFQRLGLTAVAAAIAPKLFANDKEDLYMSLDAHGIIEPGEFEFVGPTQRIINIETQEFVVPTLHYYVNGQHFELPYREGWRKPRFFEPWLTVMVLPRQLSWAKHVIILRDTLHNFHTSLEVDSLSQDYSIIGITDKKVEVTPKTYTFPDELGTIAIKKDKTWQ